MNIFLAAVIFLIVARRHLRPKPIKRDLYFWPLLLLCCGAYSAAGASVGTGESISLLLGAVIGAFVGILQGFYTKVYAQNGLWMEQGSVWSLAVWLLSFPLRMALTFLMAKLFGVHFQLVGSNMWVPVLVSIAGMMLGKAFYLTRMYPQQVAAASRLTVLERRSARKA